MNTNQVFFFIMETCDIVKRYEHILSQKPTTYFTETTFSDRKEYQKQKLEHHTFYYDFMLTCRRYKTNWDQLVCNFSNVMDCATCEGCGVMIDINVKEQPCKNCGHEPLCCKRIEVISNESTRLNMMNKYTYERLNNFRDTMMRVQGKQQSKIPKHVYEQIIDMIEKNHNKLEQCDVAKIRYSNVTRRDISNYMRELRLKKYYNDVVYIHSKLTGRKPFSIDQEMENLIVKDFKSLLSLYNRYDKDGRRSFLNSQYLLCKLLKRHGVNVNTNEFNFLKTRDRVVWHDDLCRKMFLELGWDPV